MTLHLGFTEDWTDLDEEIDLFDVLFVRPNGKQPGGKLRRFTVTHWLYDEAELGNSFQDINPFKNLDCLTLYNITDGAILKQLGRCKSLKVRKLRLKISHWEPASKIIGSGTLQLLQIEISRAGMNYQELVPLICRSGSKLLELRLEWESRMIVRESKREVLSREMTKELVTKCWKLQHLSLRADFEEGVWVCFASLSPTLWHA
jgi:hypothetical protein